MEPTIDTNLSDTTPDSDDIIKSGNTDPNAAPISDIGIEVKQYRAKTGEEKEDVELSDGVAAEVEFTEGVDASGKTALKNGDDVKFYVYPKDGYKIADAGVTAEIADGEKEPVKDKLSGDIAGGYTIATNKAASGSGDDAVPKGFTGNIIIKIVATPVKSTFALSEEYSKGKAYILKDGAIVEENEVTNAKSPELSFEDAGKEVTLAVSGLEAKYPKISLQVGGGAAKEISASGTMKAGTPEATYTLFSFTPSEVEGFQAGDDTAITIMLDDTGAAKTLSLALDTEDKWSASKVTKPAADDAADKITAIQVNDDANGFSPASFTEDNYKATGEGNAAKKNVLIFAVTIDEEAGLKLKGTDPVYAELTADSDDESTVVKKIVAGHVARVEENKEVKVDEYYKIDLSTALGEDFVFTEDMTLTIKADTEADTTKEGVHTITFDGDLAHVALTSDGTNKLENPYTAKVDTVAFQLKPATGYDIACGTDYNGTDKEATYNKQVVTVAYDKVYSLAKKDSTSDEKVTVKVPVSDEEIVLDGDATDGYSGEFDFNHSADKDNEADFKDTAWEGKSTEVDDSVKGAQLFTRENVVVTVKTTIDTDMGGVVTIDAEGIDYVVETGSGVENTYGNKYAISKGTELLALDIPSDVKPVVTYKNGTSATVTGEAGAYRVELPVNQLADDGDGTIEDTIVIRKAQKNLVVKAKIAGVDATQAQEEILANLVAVDGETLAYDATNGATISLSEGKTASVTVTAPNGTELGEVTTEVGAGDAVKAELGEDKSSLTLSLDMTDNIEVTVDLKNVYTTSVTYGGKAADEKDGAYVIPTGSTTIVVSLFNGLGTAATIKYAKIYDGEAIAATKGKVAGGTVTIDKIDDNDKGDLRVEMTAADRSKTSVTIKREDAASALEVYDAAGKKVTSSISLMADSAAANYTVKAASGNLDYAKTNIGVELVAAADEETKGTAALSNESVEITYADGALTVKALPATAGKDGAAFIRFYDIAARAKNASDKDAADKLCLMAEAISVDVKAPSVLGEKPTVKDAGGSDRTIKLELSTTDKVVAPASNNEVLYEVTINGSGITDELKTQYVKKTVFGKNNAQTAELTVQQPKAEGDKPAEGSAVDYTVSVKLVQTTKQAAALTNETRQAAVKKEATDKSLAMSDKTAELKKISTREPLYETKLKMKPASVTVYTRQSLSKMTQAQFDKKTGYSGTKYVEFVNTKTGVSLSGRSDGENNAKYAGYEANIDDLGYVWISGGDYVYTNMGLKVTALSPDGAYASTAVVKITAAQGIHDISFVGGDTRTILKQAGPASLKLTPVLNGNNKEKTPKNKKLAFAMGDPDGYPLDSDHTVSAQIASKVKINPGNGAVTVDKGYEPSGVERENQFSIIATTAGYQSNVNGKVYVTISKTPQDLTNSAVIVDEEGNVVAKKGTLYAEDFFDEDGDNKELYVGVLAKGVDAKKNSYDPDRDFVKGVTYTSSAKSALAVDSVTGELTFIKPQAKKPVKLTLTAGDGSKKNQQSLDVNVAGYKAVGVAICDQYEDPLNDAFEKNIKVEYNGPMNATFTLYPHVKVNGTWVDSDSAEYANLKVDVKGAKIVSKAKNGVDWLNIVMNSSKATIKVSDKADKNVFNEYTIEQVPPTDTKKPAPSIKQIGKLTAEDIADAQETDEDGNPLNDVEVTFQVTNKKAAPENHARQLVLVTPDYTKTKEVDYEPEWERASKYFLDYSDAVTRQISDDGKFSLALTNLGETNYDYTPGTYALIATVGNYENGQFVPAAKDVNIKVTIPGKAAKNSLTVKGSYKLDASTMAPVALDMDGNIKTDYSWQLEDTADKDGNYAMNKITNAGTAKTNEFKTYFKVFKDGDTWKLGLQDGLDATQLAKIMDPKLGKDDREGYVTVSSGYYYYDRYNDEMKFAKQQTKDMKITVSFQNAKPVAKLLNASSVYAKGANTTATVGVFATAKSTAPMRLAGAEIISTEKDGGAALVNTTTGVVNGTEIPIKLASAEAGSYKVTLRVLAEGSVYTKMKDAGDLKKQLENGREVTVTIKVADPGEKTKNKTAFAGKDFTFTAADYNKTAKKYTLTIDAKSAIEGANITKAEILDTKFEGKDIVTADWKGGKLVLTLDRTKFATINDVKSSKFKFGKKVDIPVTFTYDNGVKAEEVKLKVTLPKPLTLEETKKAAEALEKVLEKMAADKYGATAADSKSELNERISKVIESKIPADTLADFTWALTDAKDKDGNAVYAVTLTVKEGTQEIYTHTYNMAPAVGFADGISTIKAAIENLIKNDTRFKNVKNDYSESKLMEDVNEGLKEAKVTVPSNLVMSVMDFELEPATAGAPGAVSAKICILDKRQPRPSILDDNLADIDLTIAALGNLAVNGQNVKKALAANAYDYAKLIYDELKKGTTIANLEGALKTAIENAAKEAITNPAINKIGFEMVSATDCDNEPEGDNKNVNVAFTLPKDTTKGTIAFKLTLEQTGMKPYIVDCATTPITIADSEDEAVSFQSLTAADTAVKGASSMLTVSGTKLTFTENIEKETLPEIEAVIKERLATVVKGVGLKVETKESAFVDNKAPGAEEATKATGKITITDTLGRETPAKEYTYEVTIPAIAKTITKMTVKCAQGEATAEAVTGNALNVTIPAEDGKAVTLKFTTEFTGTWLKDADKVVDYELVKQATAPDGDDKTLADIEKLGEAPTGVTFNKAAGTITVDKTATAGALYLRVMKSPLALEGDKEDTDTSARMTVVTITLKAASAGG